VVAAALVAVAPAHAEERVARAFVGDIGLAGRDVAYAVRTGTSPVRVVRQRPGRGSRLVARGAGTPLGFEWETSASSVLLSGYEVRDDSRSARVIGGSIGQPLSRLASCMGPRRGASISVWRELGAFEDLCGRGDRIVVWPLDDPGAAPAFVPVEELGRVDLAGDYVASGLPWQLEVFDRRDGRRVLLAETDLYRGADEFRAAAFDLQPDGKVAALLKQRDDKCEVAWFSPTEPQPHVVGEAACHRGGVKMRGDRIAWMARRTLVVSDLAGTKRTIARFRIRADGSTARASFGFDGRRLAYGVARCDGRTTLLLRRTTAGPTWPDADPVPCPVRAVGRAAPASVRKRVAHIPVKCPRGCHGVVRVRDVEREQGFTARPGRGRMRIKLDSRTVRELERRGSSVLALSMRWRDRDERYGPERLLAVRLHRSS
jgi:hypothetical protein